MQVKVTTDGYGHLFLPIPDKVLAELNWLVGDEVEVDIPTTGGGIRITRVGDPTTHMGGVREVIHGRS